MFMAKICLFIDQKRQMLLCSLIIIYLYYIYLYVALLLFVFALPLFSSIRNDIFNCFSSPFLFLLLQSPYSYFSFNFLFVFMFTTHKINKTNNLSIINRRIYERRRRSCGDIKVKKNYIYLIQRKKEEPRTRIYIYYIILLFLFYFLFSLLSLKLINII